MWLILSKIFIYKANPAREARVVSLEKLVPVVFPV